MIRYIRQVTPGWQSAPLGTRASQCKREINGRPKGNQLMEVIRNNWTINDLIFLRFFEMCLQVKPVCQTSRDLNSSRIHVHFNKLDGCIPQREVAEVAHLMWSSSSDFSAPTYKHRNFQASIKITSDLATLIHFITKHMLFEVGWILFYEV